LAVLDGRVSAVPIHNALKICAAEFAAFPCAMPWRRKPVSRLRYWSGTPADFKARGFKTILVYCVGPPDRDPRPRCWHYAVVKLEHDPEKWIPIFRKDHAQTKR
jgi:hypothetical protein